MLICDKRRPASREQPTLAPQRGANRPPRAGRFASLAQPYAPRLGRSRTGGATPPRPPRAAPPVASRPRVPAVCRPGGRQGEAAQGCPAVWLFEGIFLKAGPCGCAAGGSGGRAPRCSGAVVNPFMDGGRSGCSRLRLCPPSTGHRVVHGGTGHRAQRSRLFGFHPSGSAGNGVLRTE